MDRAEHLEWCKERAREYLPSEPAQAFASMISDLRQHDELSSHSGIGLGAMSMMFPGWIDSPHEVGQFVEGFN
jgi:hypothetical protein